MSAWTGGGATAAGRKQGEVGAGQDGVRTGRADRSDADRHDRAVPAEFPSAFSPTPPHLTSPSNTGQCCTQ